ncbi:MULTISPECIES: 3-deoxy-D-arabino-heptulosonate 7-phosphate synthase [unclassified Paraburkholderia]|uniref:3-deoxy-D-arabino-heptulosonate 7-phosphate synthase n=1 Tax=unclassified Paraburkholderia TaxID=2615204 RepID=UPI002AB1520A|nr:MULTISPECIES: 3-deoxy-D-arabino-heptulosonate 7-phosphate synthase [unclassified Paraburkholderia]
MPLPSLLPPLPPLPPLLDETLRRVDRRYRLPPLATASALTDGHSPATRLAVSIEAAREALAAGHTPDTAIRHTFIDALAQMIRHAMREEGGDATLQATVLRHREALVREYAALATEADHDRRAIHAGVNAIAHPAKLQRLTPGAQRDALAQLQAAAAQAAWPALAQTLATLRNAPAIAASATLQRDIVKLAENPALAHLLRLDALAANEHVRQYRSLLDRNGPRPGSAQAIAQGTRSQQRGAAVEMLAMQALDALATRLNDVDASGQQFRVVTSMRVPSAIPGSHERAKTEWDAVLLERARLDGEGADAAPWNVRLLLEAKASVDAATTDLPRLLRGLRLLAHANVDSVYAFETQQGTVKLNGASLHALSTDDAALRDAVLYCCDAPAEMPPRLLGAASRMQLLSAQTSVSFANALAERQHANAHALEPVWQALLESPHWHSVLNQYPMLVQVRDLMVHTDDLAAAIRALP